MCPVNRIDALGSSAYKLLTLFACRIARRSDDAASGAAMRSLPTAAGFLRGALTRR